MISKIFAKHPVGAISLLLALAVIFINGCGFQPRGHSAGPAGGVPNPIQIRGLAVFNDLYRELDRQLKIAGAEVVTSAGEGTFQLIITGVDRDARLLSVDSRNRAVEYELIEAATFALRAPDGRQLVAPQKLTALRIQYRPPVAVLGSDREAELLRQDMREELAGRIIQRLATQRRDTE